MQFLGRLLDTVSSVSSNLFSNPYRVKDVPLSDYGTGGKVRLKEEGRMVLYRNPACQSWDCVLMCPENPTLAIRWGYITALQAAVCVYMHACNDLNATHTHTHTHYHILKLL